MDNYVGNDTFEFGVKESIMPSQEMSGAPEVNYQNLNSFSNEVSNTEPVEQNQTDVFAQFNQMPQMNTFEQSGDTSGLITNEPMPVEINQPVQVNQIQETNTVSEMETQNNVGVFEQTLPTINPFITESSANIVNEEKQQILNQTNEPTSVFTDSLQTTNPFVVPESLGVVEQTKEELSAPVITEETPVVLEQEASIEQPNNLETQVEPEPVITEMQKAMEVEDRVLDVPKTPEEFVTNDMVYEQEVEQPEERTISMSTEDLEELTEFKKEEEVKTTDIKSLFDRVGVNVREASDIFKRNTEMKEKIDSRFEELKKLQADVSKVKKAQYDEINAYKEEVLSRLTEKKDEIEIRLNKLKEFQTSLEKEKIDFEQYRKQQKEEIERVQKEVQDAYDSRREELKRIEDVLRKQKDLIDEERNQLNLDKIQYESDKNELANNLLKFNEIVDSFTNGIDKIDKE